MATTEYPGMGPTRTGIPQAVKGLSEALLKKGAKVGVVMPLYDEHFAFSRQIARLSVPFEGEIHQVDVHRVQLENGNHPEFYLLKLPIVKIVNPLFANNLPLVEKRLGLFFDRAAAEFLRQFSGEFDIAHAHTGVDFFAYFAKTLGVRIPVVYTLHNLEKGWNLSEFEDYGFFGGEEVDSNEVALSNASRIVTVSERYAEELRAGKTMFRKYASLLEQNASKLIGISNGIEEGFNPEELYRQQLIPHAYSAGDLSGKAQCHLHLQRLLGLPEDERIPIVLWSQRFAESKGASIFAAALPNQLIKSADAPINIQIIVFGRGNADIENWMEGKAKRFLNNIRFIRYNRRNAPYEPLFIAGSDLVVAPSLEEPYGILPRKAARMGTLPWVSRVGGMADLVQDGVNGFVIPEAVEGKSVERLMDEKFTEIYRIFREDRPAWEAMQRRAMEAAAFSWDEPAEKYLEVYRQLLAANS